MNKVFSEINNPDNINVAEKIFLWISQFYGEATVYKLETDSGTHFIPKAFFKKYGKFIADKFQMEV